MSRRPDQATTRLTAVARRPIVFAAMALTCFVGHGCQRPGKRAYHEALMQEKRVLEDQLYDLAYEYEILEQKLKSMEAGHGAIDLDLELEGEGLEVLPSDTPNPVVDPEFEDETPPMSIEIDPPDVEPDILPAPGGDNELRPTPGTSPAPVPDLDPPNVQEGGESDGGADNNGSEQPKVSAASMGTSSPTRSGTGHVEEIRLNPVHTGGENFDQMPGDDGITVLIEPRGTRGEVLVQPGKVSVVVVDPAIPNDRARVARWNLNEQQVSEHLHREAGRRGIQLNLPWPQSRPENSKLHLFVRYETPDGRKLESDREFYVNLDGAVATGWTPRSRSSRSNRTARSDSPRPSSSSVEPNKSAAAEPRPRPAASAPLRQVTRPQWKPVR